MANNRQAIDPADRHILRDLASRLANHAADPVMDERRRAWRRLAARDPQRPMILAETGGVLDELIPVATLRCSTRWQPFERSLRELIFRVEEVRDDFVLEPFINCGWHVGISDYGVPFEQHRGDNAGKLGSYVWESPLKNFPADLDKLHPRRCHVDRDSTLAAKTELEELFDGILPVRMRGGFQWTQGMTWPAIQLVGLEQFMVLMMDDPQTVHRLMAFLRDDHIAVNTWLEREGLLTLNNENDYIGSGSPGYTDEPPQGGWKEGDPVRLKDLWALSESQETVGVGPDMFEEFVFQYQLPVIERFGLCYYGCCEPVHNRWHVVKRIPNLRRISVSPWCDQAFMADALGRDYIFCRKPNPTLISVERFDEGLIRRDIRETLHAAGDCPLEFAMKDVHTLCDQPSRLGRWVQIVREETT